MQGATYKNVNENADMDLALINSKKIHYSFFDNFNEGLQESFNKVDIPFDMSKNVNVSNQNKKKVKLGEYYGATDNIIDWVINNNKNDIELYKILKGL